MKIYDFAKKCLLILLILIAVGIFSPSLAENNNAPIEGINVEIDWSKTNQTIEGWGSSLCWWAGQVGNWDDERIDSLIELFTSPNELNMNIFRYNIGGGDDPSHVGGHMVKGKGKRAEMEGFKASPQANYNWNADAAQRKIMLKIREKRPDAIFEAFSNSAPYWMTISGCSAGNHNPHHDNLKPEYYEAFCDYLIDVCKHYKKEYGIEFKTLEPFNESTSGYWNYKGSQEGCHFEPETQVEIIRILYPKLKASGLNTILAASDETNLKSTIRVLKAYEKAGDIFSKVGQINTHTYGGNNAERKELRRITNALSKPFWQSETGPMGLPRKARGLENNLLLTQKLFDDMKVMGADAWLDWQLMEENNDVWGLIRCNFETQWYTILKNLYVRMQITCFFKQGYQLVESNNQNIMVAVNPGKTEWIVAFLNTEKERCSYVLNLKGVLKNDVSFEAYRTSKNENCDKIQIINPENGLLVYNAPQFSLTTFVIKSK